MPSPERRIRTDIRRETEIPAPASPRTWVQLLVVDSQLSYEDPPGCTHWIRRATRPVFQPAQFRWAALALFITALPALGLAAARLAELPVLSYLPWFVCSLMAGLLTFHEVPGQVRVTLSGFVTVAALSTSGLPVAVGCATITALSSWAATISQRKSPKSHLLAANWANLALSAAAGAIILDRVLGLPGEAGFAARIASDRFLLAFPAGSIVYVLVNTSLTSLASAVLFRRPWIPAWRSCYSVMGLVFSIGFLQTLSFIIAFGSWGALGAGTAGAVIAFLVILVLLGAGKQAVYHCEARENIRTLAGLLRTVTRPDHPKHPLAVYFVEGLLADGTRRFVSGIPPEELTFEAEEAVFDAEIAWKLGASLQAVRAYLTLHETPEGTGPFGLREPGLPVWSPVFPEGASSSLVTLGESGKAKWATAVLKDLSEAAKPPYEDLDDENRKWNRLALSGARTVHSLLERYDYGMRLGAADDLLWWQSCDLAGFGPSASPEPSLLQENPDPLADL